MFRAVGKSVSLVLVLLLLSAGMAAAANQHPEEGKTAILLAGFGTTVPSAVKAIVNISDQVTKGLPEHGGANHLYLQYGPLGVAKTSGRGR